MPDLKGKTLFITGASRGIGKAIALRAAADGANIVVVAKTAEPHPKLPGTVHTAAAEIEAAGGKALPVVCDIRDEEQVQRAVAQAVDTFGGIDILVNNASAINLTGTLETPMKRFDLMWGVNARGTFLCSQACIPYLDKAANPHILTMAPPPNLDPRWLKDHVAYTISKYGMSLCVLGMAAEFRDRGIAVNALWPHTVIATAALAMLGGPVKPELCRRPEIVSDAAHVLLTRDSRSATGNFYIDEDVLREEGITDFESYAVQPGQPLITDLFLEDGTPFPTSSGG
ncbi:MAG TPA: NAD(P)-dependent oxidoreductase [Thermoanaerobaculia bacterium]|nr:NAD(P)-dependent oxidoreductase [Thermoanaerobaculia bacterium]